MMRDWRSRVLAAAVGTAVAADAIPDLARGVSAQNCCSVGWPWRFKDRDSSVQDRGY